MNDAFFIFYQSAMVFSLVVSLFVAALAWRHRHANGAKAMVALASGTFVWTLGFLLEANSDTLDRQLFFNNIGYLGSLSVPVAWFVFALNYTSGRRLLIGWKIVAFCVIPFITAVLVWTNNLHHVMWYDEHLVTSGPFTVTAKTYGWFFWVSVLNNYILIFTGAIFLVRRLFVGTSIYVRQAVSLIIAVSLPLIWNIHYILNVLPIPRKDLTPVMFAVSGLAIVMGLLRFQLFRSIPFARRFLIQQLSDGILVFDTDNRILETNPAILPLLGVENDRDVIGKKTGDFPLLSQVLEQLSSSGFGMTEVPLAVTGEERIFELETVPMLDNDEEMVGWLAIFRDTTERKRQELQYKTIIQTTGDGFWIADIHGRFLDMNDAYCQLSGYSRKELLKMGITDIEAIEESEETAARIAKIMEVGYDRFETRHKHKDGRIIDVEVSVNYLNVSGGRLIVFVRDITERKKMQAQLIAQDRLSSIGEFTSGIAHELNNPLSSVIGYSGLLSKRELPDDLKADIDIISKEAERAARIVNNLLTFARGQPEDKSLVNINKTISKTMELRSHEQSLKNIKTVMNLAPELSNILGDEFQLLQVFLNIIINAEFFMIEANGKGTLTIVTEQKENVIRVSFTDDGPGIPKESMEHLFDPFFTTKEVGKGTGLGLSICHGIINEHNGRIWAESKPGEGATFIIELPVYGG